MNERRRTFFQEWKKRAKERLALACIAVPIAILSIVFDVPIKVINWIIGLLIASCCMYLLWPYSPLGGSRREQEEAAVQEAEWKRKVQNAADSLDMSGCDLSFDELWEYLDEEELAAIVRELQRMPPGKRVLRHAYAVVMKKKPSLNG